MISSQINQIQRLKVFLKKLENSGKKLSLDGNRANNVCNIFIAVLALILPGFLSTNHKLKQFLNNLSIWTIIVLVIIVIVYLIR